MTSPLGGLPSCWSGLACHAVVCYFLIISYGWTRTVRWRPVGLFCSMKVGKSSRVSSRCFFHWRVTDLNVNCSDLEFLLWVIISLSIRDLLLILSGWANQTSNKTIHSHCPWTLIRLYWYQGWTKNLNTFNFVE